MQRFAEEGQDTTEAERQAETAADDVVAGRSAGTLRGAAAPPPEVPGGRPLPRFLRRDFERSFAVDLGGVRIHDDADAARWSRDLSARAFTVGQHIFFNAGRYEPGTRAGRRLVAHEVAHAVQNVSTPHRDPEPLSRDTIEQPPECQLSVTLQGFTFTPVGEPLFSPGVSRVHQYLAMVLRRLAGERYEARMASGAASYLESRPPGLGAAIRQEAPGELPRYRRLDILLHVARRIVEYLDREVGRGQPRSAWLRLTAEQIELLELGQEVEDLWSDLNSPAFAELRATFPRWYTIDVLRAEVGRFGTLLRMAQIRRSSVARGHAAASSLTSVEETLFNQLLPAARVLERIRQERALFAAPLFRALWRLRALPPDAPPGDAAGPGEAQVPLLEGSARFLAFIRTQPALRDAVLNGQERTPPATVELFERYLRFIAHAVAPGGAGDQRLQDQPSDRNAPPLPSRVTAYPQLEPPYFDAALGTDHLFVMDVSFSDVYEALANRFGGFLYRWEIIQVRQQDLAALQRPEEGPQVSGEQPTGGDVFAARMRRQGQYALADLRRASSDPALLIAQLVASLGAPFVGPVTLVGVNAALRAVGEVFSTLVDLATQARNERRIVLPRPGLWVVRAYCSPNLTDDSEFRRATSVAWIPVYARSPEEMARQRLEQHIGSRPQAEARLTDLLRRAAEINESSAEANDVIRARDALAADLYGTAADVLTQQRIALTASQGQRDLPEATRRAIDRQIAQIDEQLQVRSRRAGSLRGAERLQVVFVTDLGSVIRPLIEGVPTERNGRHSWYVSDVTTPRSGHATGTGASREEALLSALVSLFESHSGYGRGELQAFVPDVADPSVGRVQRRRIEASLGALALESVERITSVLSIAAMVAAPFTGGASLAILLPVGIIGAAPSAYRVADRFENGTYRLDEQMALDVINVVASAAGAGGEMAGAARAFRLQRFLAVTGIGTDALTVMAVSYTTLSQIEALNQDTSMPEGARRAAIMSLVGGQMQAIGLIAAGRIIGHLYSGEQARGRAADEPNASVDPTLQARGSSQARGALMSGGEPPRRTRNAAFEEHLPPDLRGRVVIEEVSHLDAGTFEVQYRTDMFGTINEVLIAHGPGARPEAGLATHVPVARQLLGLTRLSARLHTLYNRVRLALGGDAPPRPGTEAFNAQFEVPKLQNRLAEIQEATRRAGAEADPAAARRDILEIQLAYYEGVLAEFNRTGHDGGPARQAIGGRTRQQFTREQLRTRFGFTSDALPVPRPANWQGAHEAAWLGYPEAQSPYYWRIRPHSDPPVLVYQSAEPGRPAMVYDAANGELVRLPDTAVQTTSTFDAIREGMPPPPDGHYYRYDPVRGWELQLVPGAAERGVPPMELHVPPDGGRPVTRPRTSGELPLISRQPYRTDIDVGGSTVTDVAQGDAYQARLRARNAALEAREAARGRLPPEPDPADRAAHDAWRRHPDVEAYFQRANDVVTASRDLGIVAADAHVQRRWPGAERVHPPPGVPIEQVGQHSSAGDFDLIYRVGPNQYVVVEAKGGSSPLGARIVEGGRRAQQGTREYYDTIVGLMSRPGTPTQGVGEALAMAGAGNVTYLHTEVRLNTVQGEGGAMTTQVTDFRVNAFDISRPGIQPPATSP